MTNRLGEETSPYLHQHRDNPVDWYPWGDEAFERARTEGKPIFLSVGYSSCHWCHVMAHESFEDADTADLMNRLFVNVKVDREERPDVDAVYMQAVQALTGRGGWPMSVWLHTRRPAVLRRHLLPRTKTATACRRSRRCARSLRRLGTISATTSRSRRTSSPRRSTRPCCRARPASGLDAADARRARSANVRAQFDPSWGGFGRAPKFPQAMTLDFLCRELVHDPAPETREMITTTLDAMAAGGIHDHLGGGFARYSTDEMWLVPHFEKMLYDNALLTRAYLHGYLATGEERYRAVVEDIVGYVLRDLTDPAGGFYAAEDADSEGIEGKFYLWSLDEIREVCGDDADEVVRYYGVTANGNFVDPHTQLQRQHPARRRPHRNPARSRRARPRRAVRAARAPHPARPRQQGAARLERAVPLGAHRGGGRARSRRLDGRRAHQRDASCCDELRSDDGRFRRSWRAPYLAYAEDYAALLEALLTLTELDDVAWLGRRASGRRRADAPVPRRRRRRVLHDRPRRRGARRPAEGSLRRRDAVGQLAGRQRLAPAGRAHSANSTLRRRRPSRSSRCSRDR